MKIVLKLVTTLFLVTAMADVSSTGAFARGGGSSFMNSPGYQRRLQESRGLVSTQSASQPYLTPPSVYPGRKWRKRGRH